VQRLPCDVHAASWPPPRASYQPRGGRCLWYLQSHLQYSPALQARQHLIPNLSLKTVAVLDGARASVCMSQPVQMPTTRATLPPSENGRYVFHQSQLSPPLTKPEFPPGAKSLTPTGGGSRMDGWRGDTGTSSELSSCWDTGQDGGERTLLSSPCLRPPPVRAVVAESATRILAGCADLPQLVPSPQLPRGFRTDHAMLTPVRSQPTPRQDNPPPSSEGRGQRDAVPAPLIPRQADAGEVE